jgi:pantoate--beta-alanine ligase
MSAPVVARTRDELAAARGSSTVAFVPTMGALHDGHVRLLEHARPLGETLVASIFVNPTQFAPGEDFEDYPRTFDADLERCAEAGVDVVFAPAVPTIFRGVLTVVAKLFGLVRPDVAVFGEKDYQQLVLITQMARELALGVDVVGCPTVREPDGLAMSSRNRYLSDDERQTAAVLSAALRGGAAAADAGPDAVLAAAHAIVDPADVDLDYLVLTDPELGPASPGADARLLVAARIGTPRLLDNIGLTLGRN